MPRADNIFTDFLKAKAEANKRHTPDEAWAIVPLCSSRLLLVKAAKTDVTLALYVSGGAL